MPSWLVTINFKWYLNEGKQTSLSRSPKLFIQSETTIGFPMAKVAALGVNDSRRPCATGPSETRVVSRSLCSPPIVTIGWVVGIALGEFLDGDAVAPVRRPLENARWIAIIKGNPITFYTSTVSNC
jgi:hypothetical protein